MYSELTVQLFDLALEQAADFSADDLQKQQYFSTDQYQLILAIDQDGQLYYQVNGSVFMIAAIQYIKQRVAQEGFAKKDLQSIAEKLQCPKIYRHQIEWMVSAFNLFIT